MAKNKIPSVPDDDFPYANDGMAWLILLVIGFVIIYLGAR